MAHETPREGFERAHGADGTRDVARGARQGREAGEAHSHNPASAEPGDAVFEALPAQPDTRTDRVTIPPSRISGFVKAGEQEPLGALNVLLALTGLRPSEALAARWGDLSDDVLHVRRVLIDRAKLPLTLAPTKTELSRRDVVLPAVVVAALRRHRKRQLAAPLAAGDAWQHSDYIFTSEVGAPVRQDWAKRGFRRTLKAAKLPRMRLYDLRHTAATVSLERGVDLATVSAMLGHSSVQLTGDVYAHPSHDLKRQAAAKLDAVTRGRKRTG